METKDAYNNWAETYDSDVNRTRDMEGLVLRQLLNDVRVDSILEIGCGTGKNTEWLATRCRNLQAVDFSEYYSIAIRNSFQCIDLKEWFDEDCNPTPRIVTYLFNKKKFV